MPRLQFPFYHLRRDVGGTGVDGTLTIPSNTATTLTGGTYNFDSLTINGTLILSGTTPIKIYCLGPIVVNGTITGQGYGYAGGLGQSLAAGLPGDGPYGGAAGTTSYSYNSNTATQTWTGYPGVSAGTNPSPGAGATAGGILSLDSTILPSAISLQAGSGGGAGGGYGSNYIGGAQGWQGGSAAGGNGGAGGSAFMIETADLLTVAGTITSAGAAGLDNGGAGAGGTIYLRYGALSNSGTITAGSNGYVLYQQV